MKPYFAFISYAHVDAAAARWLHKSLETYRLPRALAQGEPVQRLAPVFLDRAELATSTELASEVQSALERSQNLVVVCSPAAARSRWVNEEIRRFRALGRSDRIFCVIVGAEGGAGEALFPPALSEAVAAGDGAAAPAEPLAADFRPHADGRRDGFLKLVAGLLGLRFDQLRQREQTRRNRRLLAITSASVAMSVVLAGLAVFALFARQEAERQRSIAEQRSLTAERTTEFLQSLFEVSDPSEARGESITAKEVLDRGASRISEGLAGEPAVRATLITTLGSVYASLGSYRQAEDLLGSAASIAPLDPSIAAKYAIALGELRLAQGDYAAANAQLGGAIEALRPLGDELDADRARALIAWGESLASTEEFAAAEEKIARGLEIARQSKPQSAGLIARGIEARALTSLLSGDLDAAEPAYEEALAARIAASGELHPKVVEDLGSLGSIEYLRGNLDQAARYFERALPIERKILGPEHPDVAGTLNNLGRIHIERRAFREARAQLLGARDLMLAEKSATHDDMAFVFNNLALAEAGLGNDAAASEFFSLAWAAAEKHRHRMRGPILTDRADLDCRARRFSEANDALGRAQALIAEDYPDDPWRRSWLELVRASCRMLSGDVPGADALVATHLPVVLERWPDTTNYGLSALRKGLAIRQAAGDSQAAAALAGRIERATAAPGIP